MPKPKPVATVEDLNKLRDLAFRVEKLENATLTILVSFDFTQYVQYRITFYGVRYVNLPTGWNLEDNRFEESAAPEDFTKWYGHGPLRALKLRLDGFEFRVYFDRFELEKI